MTRFRDGKCVVCEESTAVLDHHVSWIPEQTVQVCDSCHGRIHDDSDELSDLTPAVSREDVESGDIDSLEVVLRPELLGALEVTRDKNKLESLSAAIHYLVATHPDVDHYDVEDTDCWPLPGDVHDALEPIEVKGAAVDKLRKFALAEDMDSEDALYYVLDNVLDEDGECVVDFRSDVVV